MRIDDNFAASSDLVRSTQLDRTQQVENERAGQRRDGFAPTDTASLSSLSTQVTRALSAESPEQVQTLERLQESVNNGTLNVPSDQVARAVVAASLAERGNEVTNPLTQPPAAS